MLTSRGLRQFETGRWHGACQTLWPLNAEPRYRWLIRSPSIWLAGHWATSNVTAHLSKHNGGHLNQTVLPVQPTSPPRRISRNAGLGSRSADARVTCSRR
jgi:hypothetical protein